MSAEPDDLDGVLSADEQSAIAMSALRAELVVALEERIATQAALRSFAPDPEAWHDRMLELLLKRATTAALLGADRMRE